MLYDLIQPKMFDSSFLNYNWNISEDVFSTMEYSKESDNEFFTIKVDAPGIKKEDFDLRLEDTKLSLSFIDRFGNRKYQRWTILKSISKDINCSYKDGILSIVLKKDNSSIYKIPIT